MKLSFHAAIVHTQASHGDQNSKQPHFNLEFVDVKNDTANTPQTANAQRSAAATPSLEPTTNHSSEAFKFRLFSNSSTSAAAAVAARSLQKRGTHFIRIYSPSPPLSSTGAGAMTAR